ncbi:MAG: Two Component Transcriptional Regulator, LuxR family protein [Candidatus Jorgensenbacteria bacterium GW2011_GWA2_45_9]|nr:MAG: Two Component Transcriptional Regulator, LuxR family protein [Candidatus Jorgensenbacteria bacterium GW2011_GWA2_45_9]
MKILLVEDEPLLGNLLRERLAREGFDVTHAKNGEEGFELLKKSVPDLVLLDIILPKMSGFEFMEKVRTDSELQSAPPIVIISNLGQDGDIERGQELGAVGYFIKAKISMEDLVSKIKEYMFPAT